MTVLTAIAVPRMRAASRRLDITLCCAVMAVAVVVGWYAAALAQGLMPAHNALFDADTGRVLGNFTGQTDSYYRLKVHPWQGWIFAVYQIVLAKVLAPPIAVPAINIAIATVTAGLLYAVLRRLEIGPWAAASHTLLFTSLAGFVFWSSLPEAHMLGGASTLAAVLLLTGERQSRLRSSLALAVSFSMVVTDAMVWVLRQIDFAPLRRGWRAFVQTNLAQVPDLLRQGGMALGIIFAVWAPQWLLLHKRLGIPFNFLEERHYVEAGGGGASVYVLGILPPDGTGALILALGALAVLIAALRLLPPRLWFVPAFPLFGVVLHGVYGADSAFLFSPNYLPLFVVSLALVLAKALPRWEPAVVLPAAALLLAINLGAYANHLEALDASGQMKTYQAAVHYM